MGSIGGQEAGVARRRRAIATSFASALLAPFLAACEAGWEPGSDSLPELPDIVVVTLDTTRADHLGAYGYFRDTSPHFDDLARNSLLFSRYVVSISSTLPSHLSLFTMLEPDEHGVVANAEHARRFALSRRVVPLAGYAKSIGLATAAFVSAIPIRRDTGVETGFDHFDDPTAAKRQGARTVDLALRWLAEIDRPFLLWVHLFDPHVPFDAPPPFDAMFRDDAALSEHVEAAALPRTVPTPRGIDLSVRRHLNQYDGEIRYMDESFGRLVEGLRSRERWSKTVILVAGDHGESLGAHGMIGHGDVWDEQLQAPLLMRVPGREAERIDTLVTNVDVLPTLLSMLDLPGSAAWLEQSSGGNVLGDGRRSGVVSRSSWGRVKRPTKYSLTTERWKYVQIEGGEPQLFDLQADGRELRDLASDWPGVRETMRAELMAQRERQKARGGDLRGELGAELDPEHIEQLRSLGYVDDE